LEFLPTGGAADEPAPRKPLRRAWRVPWAFAIANVVVVVLVVDQGQTAFSWICLVLAFLGFAAIVPGGVVDRIRVATFESARRRRPDEPWMWDHRWDASGMSRSGLRQTAFRDPRVRWTAIFLVLDWIALSPPGTSAWLACTPLGLLATWAAW